MKIIIYLISSLLFLLFAFLVFRVLLRRDYQNKGRTTWFTIILETLVFALHANFSYLFIPAVWPAWPTLSENSFQQTMGLILIVFGIILTLAAMASLGYKRLFGQGSDAIAQSGFYRFTRNPQIIFYGLVVIGIAVLWPSWYAVFWIILYGLIAHMMIITEEEYLLTMHGENYQVYCKKVPRYIKFNFKAVDKDTNN
jgi:protein-S-isoprenylcysteine O-methyltransferase Ste14